jgi:uncharacterized protein YdaU (DUF1376 family)
MGTTMPDAIPYMRLFVGSFTSDTQHLSAAQLGHHLRLLMLAWRRASCSIPDDSDWICRRLGIEPEEYGRDIVPMIGDLWLSDGEDLHNEEQRAEMFHCLERSEKARRAAQIRHSGAKIVPLKTNEK